MKYVDLIPYIFGAGGLVASIITWVRFRKKDAVSVDKIKADGNKTNAEAQEIRAKSDVLITDGALRIVDRLSKDLDEARDEIEKLIQIVSDLKILHEKHKIESRAESEELQGKLREARDLIEIKKRHCVEIKNRIIQLQELLQLKQAAGQAGLSHEQFDIFIKKLGELILFNENYETGGSK